jgi:hypothetical protein
MRWPDFLCVVLRDEHHTIPGRTAVDLVQMFGEILAPKRRFFKVVVEERHVVRTGNRDALAVGEPAVK